jgi:hypothetical protein
MNETLIGLEYKESESLNAIASSIRAKHQSNDL